LIAFERTNGGKVTSAIIAQDMAFTTTGGKEPTHEYNEACKLRNLVFGIHTAIGWRLFVVGSELPVKVDDEAVGGIELSSGTQQQNMDWAQAGVDHFLSQIWFRDLRKSTEKVLAKMHGQRF